MCYPVSMAKLHDGDVFKLSDNPSMYLEFLDTNGRVAFRITDRHGKGLCLERDALNRLFLLLAVLLDKPEMNWYDEITKNL